MLLGALCTGGGQDRIPARLWQRFVVALRRVLGLPDRAWPVRAQSVRLTQDSLPVSHLAAQPFKGPTRDVAPGWSWWQFHSRWALHRDGLLPDRDRRIWTDERICKSVLMEQGVEHAVPRVAGGLRPDFRLLGVHQGRSQGGLQLGRCFTGRGVLALAAGIQDGLP